MQTTLLIFGLVCLISAVIGGGLKALGIEIPVVGSVLRQLALFFLGLILVGISMLVDRGGDSPLPKPLEPRTVTVPPAPQSGSPAPQTGSQILSGPVSRITGIPLPGEPTLLDHDSNDDQYRQAVGILRNAADRQGSTVVRVELIKWLHVDKAEAYRLREELEWEVKQRVFAYSSSPYDLTRETFWTEARDFEIIIPSSKQKIIGYCAVDYSGSTGDYMLIWAWALLP
jgi:hypothetical protein